MVDKSFGLSELKGMQTEFTIEMLRKERRETQEAFGIRIGLKGKSSVSELEKTNRASLDVALAIEGLSIKDGVRRIDAAMLNDAVARARDQDCKDVECHGGDACVTVFNHSTADSSTDAASATGTDPNASREVAV
jgi:DNA-binding XRE family transcriptional regulator